MYIYTYIYIAAQEQLSLKNVCQDHMWFCMLQGLRKRIEKTATNNKTPWKSQNHKS